MSVEVKIIFGSVEEAADFLNTRGNTREVVSTQPAELPKESWPQEAAPVPTPAETQPAPAETQPVPAADAVNVPTPAPAQEAAPAPTPAAAETTVDNPTIDDIKAILVRMKASGQRHKFVDVKNILTRYGLEGVSKCPAEQVPALYQEIKALEG